jgi:hypothetical protein
MKNLLIAIVTITIFASCEKMYVCTHSETTTSSIPKSGYPKVYSYQFAVYDKEIDDVIQTPWTTEGMGKDSIYYITTYKNDCDDGKRQFKKKK